MKIPTTAVFTLALAEVASAGKNVPCGVASDCKGYKGCPAAHPDCKCANGKCRRFGKDCKLWGGGTDKWDCRSGAACATRYYPDGRPKKWGKCKAGIASVPTPSGVPSPAPSSGSKITAPTTAAPTTTAPTTTAPTTTAPTTTAPTSTAPTTTAPTTTAPTSTAPTSTAPTTTAPTSTAPTTTTPTSTAPTSTAPTSMAPTSMAPTSTAPTSSAPTSMAPSTLGPTSPLGPFFDPDLNCIGFCLENGEREYDDDYEICNEGWGSCTKAWNDDRDEDCEEELPDACPAWMCPAGSIFCCKCRIE